MLSIPEMSVDDSGKIVGSTRFPTTSTKPFQKNS